MPWGNAALQIYVSNLGMGTCQYADAPLGCSCVGAVLVSFTRHDDRRYRLFIS